MKRFIFGAIGLALAAMTLAPAPTAALENDETAIEIYVVNSHIVPVRIFAQDADGRLHSLGRIAAGDILSVDVPAEIAADEYRLKFVPAPTDAWSPVNDVAAIKTVPLSRDRVRQVTVWIEPTLEQSGVDIITATPN